MQLLNTYRTKTRCYVPLGRNDWYFLIFISKWRITTNWTEWMKGIGRTWSRGRHFSPSLPGDRYLNLGSKSDHRAEIFGNIVRYDALAPRPEVLRLFSSLYANIFGVLGILFCAGANFRKLIYSIPSKTWKITKPTILNRKTLIKL